MKIIPRKKIFNHSKYFILFLILILQSMSVFSQSIDKTHPAYSTYNNLKRNLKSAQGYIDKGKTGSNMFKKYYENAEASYSTLKSKYPDASYEAEEKHFKEIKALIEGGASKYDEAEAYFSKFNDIISKSYSNTSNGADGSQVDKDATELFEQAKDFIDKEEFFRKIEEAKSSGIYKKMVKYKAESVIAILNDYDNYISKSQNTFNRFIGRLSESHVKGNALEELKVLKNAEALSKLFLLFSPENATAKQWLSQVNSKMENKKSSMASNSSSDFHANNIGKVIFFKNVQPAIGEEENSKAVSNHFKSGDRIYCRAYLPGKARPLTDSYAWLPSKININGLMMGPAKETAFHVSSTQQEQTYFDFALIPDKKWLAQNMKPYADGGYKTMHWFSQELASKGGVHGVKVEIELQYRGEGRLKVKGDFIIDLDEAGLAVLEEVRSTANSSVLAGVKLPKAGMKNPALEQQALSILKQKSSDNGVAYSKPIIINKSWDIDRNWNGTVISRSIVIAIVGKKTNGSCFYQLFNFKQAEQGNGTYSKTLEYAGAGDNFDINCE